MRDSFDAWCAEAIAPWVRDHVEMDSARAARWSGAERGPRAPLPSDLVLAAASVDEGSGIAGSQPYLAMTGRRTPWRRSSRRARRVYETGWRPAYAEGPSRDELARIVSSAA